MRLLEGLLQRLQLLRGEGRAAAALLAVLRAVASLQDDVFKCAAVGRQETHAAGLLYWPREFLCISFIFKSVSHGVASNINSKSKAHSITSESLGQRERVHGGPVVGRVLRLLRGLLVQVVHGAEGVHGVQRVAVHPVVLHAGSGSRPAREGGKEKE